MKRASRILAIITALIVLAIMAAGLTACREADRVSYNVSKEADNFNVVRRLTVINTRTDKCILQMTGKMSLKEDTDGIAVLVELDRDKGIYQKHFIWMNDWTMYTCEDISGTNISKYAYEMEFMPQAIVPVKITANELKQDAESYGSPIEDFDTETEETEDE